MAKIIYYKQALTNGSTISVDGIDGAVLGGDEMAFVLYSGNFYAYILDADSGLTESSPDRIVPDTNPGTKVWLLQNTIPGGVNVLVYKGIIACAGNPNYPAGDAGHIWVVSSAGKIGGASGTVVGIGDMLMCNTDGTTSGDEAAKGAYWDILEGGFDLTEYMKTADLGATITAATNENTPLDADDFPFYKASLTALRKVTWTNIKATLKSYFDGLYTLANLGGVPTTRTLTATAPITIDNTTSADLSANRTFAITASNTTTAGSVVAATAPSAGMRSVLAIDNGETARSDKALFDATHPSDCGTAAEGSAMTAARIDHVHKQPTAAETGAATTATLIDAFGVCGTSNTDRDANTTNHGLLLKAVAPASPLTNIIAIENGETVYKLKALFDTTHPVTQAYDDAADEGSAATAARRDHKHGMPAAGTIADESITNAKLAHIATSTIKGRVAAGTGDVEDLSAANVRTIINVADGATANAKASGAEINAVTDDVKYATSKAIGDSTINMWRIIPAANYTTAPASTSTLTMGVDMTASIKVGMTLRYTISAVEYFGQVSAIASNLLTVRGAPLGGNVSNLQYGGGEVTQMVICIPGLYADASSTGLVAADLKMNILWRKPKSYCVYFSMWSRIHETGTHGTASVRINGTELNTTAGGLTIAADATLYATVVDIATAAYDINDGEAIEITSVKAGSGDASDLTATMIFITP
jgi:hypothetical protein